MSSKVFKRIFRWISEVKILTDKSLVFSNFQEIKTFKFLDLLDSTELNKEMERLAEISLIVSGNTQLYYRSYKKLFDVISNIGGFYNGIIHIVYIILHLYSKNTIIWHCISSIMSEQEISDCLNKPLLEKIKIDKRNNLKPEIVNIEPVNNLNIQENINKDSKILRENERPETKIKGKDSNVHVNRSVYDSRMHLNNNNRLNLNQELQNRNHNESNNLRQ